MSFFRLPKMCKSQGERSRLYGGYWSVSQPNLWSLSLTKLAVWGRALSCKRMIPSDSIPGCFDFMASRSTLSHQETNHTSLLFFACIHFQYWANALYTTLTSRAINKQLCGPVRFHYACLLPYRWQYRYVTTLFARFCEECVLWRVFDFHLIAPHILRVELCKDCSFVWQLKIFFVNIVSQ